MIKQTIAVLYAMYKEAISCVEIDSRSDTDCLLQTLGIITEDAYSVEERRVKELFLVIKSLFEYYFIDNCPKGEYV